MNFEKELLEEIKKSKVYQELILEGFTPDETYSIIEKSWSTDLMKRFPNGQWKTINGAKVFINNGKVVAGLDNFNGLIDDFFKEKNKKGNLKQKYENEYKNIKNKYEETAYMLFKSGKKIPFQLKVEHNGYNYDLIPKKGNYEFSIERDGVLKLPNNFLKEVLGITPKSSPALVKTDLKMSLSDKDNKVTELRRQIENVALNELESYPDKDKNIKIYISNLGYNFYIKDDYNLSQDAKIFLSKYFDRVKGEFRKNIDRDNKTDENFYEVKIGDVVSEIKKLKDKISKNKSERNKIFETAKKTGKDQILNVNYDIKNGNLMKYVTYATPKGTEKKVVINLDDV